MMERDGIGNGILVVLHTRERVLSVTLLGMPWSTPRAWYLPSVPMASGHPPGCNPDPQAWYLSPAPLSPCHDTPMGPRSTPGASVSSPMPRVPRPYNLSSLLTPRTVERTLGLLLFLPQIPCVLWPLDTAVI